MAQPLLHTIIYFYPYESNAKMLKRKNNKMQKQQYDHFHTHALFFLGQLLWFLTWKLIKYKCVKSNLFIKDFNAQQRLGSINNTGDRDRKLWLCYELCFKPFDF